MKKINIILCVLAITILCNSVSYAGQWKNDENGYWYQNDDGSYKTGWHQDIDGRWYYFDTQSGYMLTNTVTPDGYIVSESGEWIEGEDNIIGYSEKKYDNQEKMQVTAYQNRSEITALGYSLPVDVFYNNEYSDDKGRKIDMLGFETSKNGVLYYKYKLNKDGYYYEFKITHVYLFEDGSEQTFEDKTGNFGHGADAEEVGSLLWEMSDLEKNPTSVQIYIDLSLID